MNTNEWKRSYYAEQGWSMVDPHVRNYFHTVPDVYADNISDIYDDWWAVYNGMAV